MKAKTWMLLPLTGALVAHGCSGTRDMKSDDVKPDKDNQKAHVSAARDDDDDDGEDEAEEQIDLAQVPEAALKAAKAAVPGVVFDSAEREQEHGATVYSLSGKSNGEAEKPDRDDH